MHRMGNNPLPNGSTSSTQQRVAAKLLSEAHKRILTFYLPALMTCFVLGLTFKILLITLQVPRITSACRSYFRVRLRPDRLQRLQSWYELYVGKEKFVIVCTH